MRGRQTCVHCVFYRHFQEEALEKRTISMMWCEQKKIEITGIDPCSDFEKTFVQKKKVSIHADMAWEKRRMEDALWQMELAKKRLRKKMPHLTKPQVDEVISKYVASYFTQRS